MPRISAFCINVICPVALFLLCGCAVTRIDVDVYKGPMANHADVQAEQLAALAMGAKPLLIELRDAFDSISVNRLGQVKIDGSQNNNLDYAADFIARPRPDYKARKFADGQQWLFNQQAIQVNAILSLYQDRTDVRLVDLTNAAHDALQRYQDAWEIYTNAAGQDQRIWDALKVPDSTTNKELREAYKGLLIASKGYRKQWLIFFAAGQDKRYATNDQFSQLADDRNNLVTNDAARLFSDDSKFQDQRAAFVQRVHVVSQAFLNARKAVQDLLHVSFQIALRVSDQSFPVSERQSIVLACAEFIVQLIDPTFLYVALCDTNSVALDLKSKLDPNASFFDCKYLHPAAAFAAKKLELHKRLKNLLITEPTLAVDDLIKIDALFQNANTTKCFALEPEENRYGLACVRPTADNEQLAGDIVKQREKDYEDNRNKGGRISSTQPPQTEQVRPESSTENAPLLSSHDELQKLSSGGSFQSGVGLEGGRLDEGLVTSINNYLATTKAFDKLPQPAGAKDSLESKRRTLVRQLIHFSEKLIFVADNQFLLSRDNQYGAFKDFQRFNRAAAVLQTIGNSILVAANELYEREDYSANRDGLVAKQRVEAALEQVRLSLAGSALKSKVADFIADPAGVADQVTAGIVQKATNAASDQAKADQELQRARAELAKVQADVANDTKTLERLSVETKLVSADLSAETLIQQALADQVKDPKKQSTPSAVLAAVSQAVTDAYVAATTSKDSVTVTHDSAILDFIKLVNIKDANSPMSSAAAEKEVHDALASAVVEVPKAVGAKQNADQAAADKLVGQIPALEATAAKNKTAADDAAAALSAAKLKAQAALQLILKQFNSLPLDKLVHDFIAKALSDARENEKDAGKQEALDLAIKIWMSIQIPEPINIIPNPQNATPRDAMDDLLVNLRMQHVNAVQQLGASSPRVQELEAAIHVAELYRSDMVYIRPPAAYLRTSNVATVLQQGGRDVQWQNLLQQQAFRTTPFIGPALNAETEQNPDYAAIRAVDRQFWQNINSVRVAGSGITNYVITKDDIGNWYVKNYAGDPTPIIEAAKTTALFNAGNIVGGASAANRLLQRDQDPNSEPQTTVDLQMSTFTNDYNSSTTSFVAELVGDTTKSKSSSQASLNSAFNAAWANDASLTDIKDKLAGVQKAAETSTDIAKDAGIAADSDTTKDAKLPDKILTALRGFKAYQDRLLSGIDNLHLENSDTIKTDRQSLADKQAVQTAALAKAQAANPSSADQAALAAADKDVAEAQGKLNTHLASAQQETNSAKADVISAFAGILNPLVQKRLDAVTTYSTALGVLQKASAAKAAPTTQKSTKDASVPAS